VYDRVEVTEVLRQLYENRFCAEKSRYEQCDFRIGVGYVEGGRGKGSVLVFGRSKVVSSAI
jgi:hypothetical protein